MSDLETLRKRASEAYYIGEPFLTNEEYDALFGDSGPVGSGDQGEIPHFRPMWSLQKYYAEDGQEPPVKGNCVRSLKYDGAAVSLLYVDGVFTRALTRGDGEKGRPITDKMALLVPNQVKDLPGIVQITGEVVAWERVPNARNYASGALNLKDTKEFEGKVTEGGLKFMAYGVESSQGPLLDSYSKELQHLFLIGFETVLSIESNEYPSDGYVCRLDSNKAYYALGYTAKHPRGAYAEKTRDTPVETILRNVIWQTGKSGKVAPVGILEPVLIEDATISRVTLNNMDFINAMNLEIGCRVKVIRAGKIIPCIVGKAD